MTAHSLNAGVLTIKQDNQPLNEALVSDGLRLAAHLAWPQGAGRVPALVLCHGFPVGPRGAATSAATYPDLAERVARDTGWAALAFNFRGAGTSEGDFSAEGWLADLRAAVDSLAGRDDVSAVCVAGVAEGGTVAICEAGGDPRVAGVATLGAPLVPFHHRDPGELLAHARRVGMVRTPAFPPDPAAWERQVAALDALAAARRLAPRPLLVVHGTADDVVAVSGAQALAEAGGPGAELRLVHAAGHRLRHDPRAVALLLGWLDRQRP
jgi:uncharacterized protein